MRFLSRCLLKLLVASAPLTSADAQLPVTSARPSAVEVTARVDSVVNTEILPRGFPSVSIVVTRSRDTLVDRAWGTANIATGQKADVRTTYRIGSIGKQFTAALVMKLVGRGKLRTSDSIGQYLSGLREEWKSITIAQLLNHTSGLPREFLDIKRVGEKLNGTALIALAASDSLVTKPGTTYAYSNTGYMMLATLVEKLFGRPYAVVLRDEIAKPLGLTTLHICEDVAKGAAATGYVRSSESKLSAPNYQHVSQNLGFGDICANARDIARWNQALHTGRVVSAQSYRDMITPQGATKSYGFGLLIRKSLWGGKAIAHDGVTNGFSSHNAWYPAESLSVTLLYNGRPRLDEAMMADVIGQLALGITPKPIPKSPPVVLPEAAIQAPGRPPFVGAYEITIGAVFIVTFEDGNLYVAPPNGKKQQLFLKTGTMYSMGTPDSGTTVTFNVDASGATSLTARQNGVDRELVKVK